jgi:hypothetical protein
MHFLNKRGWTGIFSLILHAQRSEVTCLILHRQDEGLASAYGQLDSKVCVCFTTGKAKAGHIVRTSVK